MRFGTVIALSTILIIIILLLWVFLIKPSSGPGPGPSGAYYNPKYSGTNKAGTPMLQ